MQLAEKTLNKGNASLLEVTVSIRNFELAKSFKPCCI